MTPLFASPSNALSARDPVTAECVDRDGEGVPHLLPNFVMAFALGIGGAEGERPLGIPRVRSIPDGIAPGRDLAE